MTGFWRPESTAQRNTLHLKVFCDSVTIVPAERINALSGATLTVLAIGAFVTVLVGFTQPPLPDEGALAHIFQLTIAALLPTGAVFVATADWSRPAAPVKSLVLPAVFVILAFSALYYLEHVYYVR